MGRFDGRVAVITGSARGIGYGATQAVARRTATDAVMQARAGIGMGAALTRRPAPGPRLQALEQRVGTTRATRFVLFDRRVAHRRRIGRFGRLKCRNGRLAAVGGRVEALHSC